MRDLRLLGGRQHPLLLPLSEGASDRSGRALLRKLCGLGGHQHAVLLPELTRGAVQGGCRVPLLRELHLLRGRQHTVQLVLLLVRLLVLMLVLVLELVLVVLVVLVLLQLLRWPWW